MFRGPQINSSVQKRANNREKSTSGDYFMDNADLNNPKSCLDNHLKNSSNYVTDQNPPAYNDKNNK